FMTIEAGQCQCMTHYALVFVQYDEATATHHGAGGKTTVRQALVVHHPRIAFRCFEQQVLRQDGNGGTTGDTGFQPFSIVDATTILITVDESFYRDGHVYFVNTRFVDVATGRDELGTGGFTHTDLCIFFS